MLTLKDVESLFATVSSTVSESDGKTTENLRHLPPSVAAALAAERRLKENTAGIYEECIVVYDFFLLVYI